MEIHRAEDQDRDFVVEMAVLACGLDDRPLPGPDDEAVLALLPGPADLALIATAEGGARIGAAWWHFHEPPLVLDDRGEPLPEITMAVAAQARGAGTGGRLLGQLAAEAARCFSGIVLNVHMRNPAARLYMRNGFKVAAKGRGWYGVAMIRSLDNSLESG